MRILLLPCLIVGLLLTASCDKQTDPQPEICYFPTPLKTVQDQEGTVRYNGETKEYAIVVTRSGITGSIDVGVLQQTLPQDLRVDGTKVIFSGSYYEKPGAATSGDIAEYYLTFIEVRAK